MKNFVFVVLSFSVLSLAACNGRSSSTVRDPQPTAPESQVSQNEESVVTPSPSQSESVVSQNQSGIAESTLRYWQGWKDLRERDLATWESLLAEYSVENSSALASLDAQLADDLGSLSAVNVDRELAELAAAAIVLYRERAGLLQQQAALLSAWQTFVAKRDSDEAAIGGVLVFLFNEEDRFAVPKALAAEAEQIKSEWNRNEQLLAQHEQNIQALITQRDTLKIKLESRYGVVFEN